MTERQRRNVITANAADVARMLGKDFSPLERFTVFLYMCALFTDKGVYRLDISEFDSVYVEENMEFLFEGIRSLGDQVDEQKINRICIALTAIFADETDALQRKADAVNRRL